MTYRASGRKSAPARRPVGHFTSKECAMNLGINAISLQPLEARYSPRPLSPSLRPARALAAARRHVSFIF